MTQLLMNPKVIVPLGILAAVALYFQSKVFTKLLSNIPNPKEFFKDEEKEKEKEDLNEGYADLFDKLSEKTFYDEWYKQKSNDLFNAMSGAGTDETVIFEIFEKLKTNDDVIALDAAFGNKDIWVGFGWMGYSQNGNMTYHLKTELSEEDYSKISDKIKAASL